jgi:hypothetical protein
MHHIASRVDDSYCGAFWKRLRRHGWQERVLSNCLQRDRSELKEPQKLLFLLARSQSSIEEASFGAHCLTSSWQEHIVPAKHILHVLKHSEQVSKLPSARIQCSTNSMTISDKQHRHFL